MNSEETVTTEWGGSSANVLNKVPKDEFTRRQAAQMVGRSLDTLRRWHADGTYKATHWRKIGQRKMWLYTEDDIARMRMIAAGQKPGPKKPPTEDEDESEE
jgi:hypothetical protein